MSTPDPLFNGTPNIVKEIYDAVLRLTGKMETLISQHDEQRADIKDHENRIRLIEANLPKDHEPRIRQLESGRWPLPTLSVMVAVAALVLTFIKNFL